MFYNSANPITITLTKKIIFVFINVGINFLDAYLTRGSGSVEATKRESKDTQVNQLLHQVSEKDTHSQASIDRLQVCGLEEVTTLQQEQFEFQPREIDHLVKSLQIQPREDTQPDNNLTADAYLTTSSDPVEATKRESKDPQPVKKVHTCSVIMRFPQQQ